MDIKNTSVALYLLLRTGQAPKTPLFVQLARLPLEKNYLSLEFSPDIFHQEYGIGMETPFAVTEANAFMYLHEKDIIDRYSSYLILYKRFIDDILAIWDGTKDTLLEFLDTLNSKAGRIKLTYYISNRSISFLDSLHRDISSNELHFSTFQKPLNKYLFSPFELFHPSRNKKAFIKGQLMGYARNSSSFASFAETREKFWERVRLRGYQFGFLLPLFLAIRYSDRTGWLRRKPYNTFTGNKTIVFKTTFNCSHARIKHVISQIQPDLDCTVCCKSAVILANLCK